MEFFRIHRDIPFMRRALTFNVISAVTFVFAVVFLATRGLNLGVDFRGGTVIEVTYDHAADFQRIRDIVDRDIAGEASVQSFGTSTTALIRLPLKDDYSKSPISACLSERAAQNRSEGKSASGAAGTPRPGADAASNPSPAPGGSAKIVRRRRLPRLEGGYPCAR